MPFIRVPNTVMVEMVYRWDGQTVENVFHASNAVSYDETDIADLLDVFRLWGINDALPTMSNTVTLVNLIGTDLDSATGPRIEDATGLPVAGSAVSPSMPNNVSVVVKWTTANRGRSYRGRTYWIGLREDVVAANQIVAAQQTAIVNAATALLADVALAGWALVVASRYTDNAPRAQGITTPITGFSVEPTIDSQRRRLPGRGS